MKKIKKGKITPYLCITPAVLFLTVFLLLSIILGFITALTDKMPGRTTNFVGLQNFITLFSDRIFWISFKNQVIITVAAVVFSVFFPLMAAMILYDIKSKRLSGIIKILFVIPMLVPSIVTILIWKYLYNPNFGFNSFLQLFNLSSWTHNWLNNESTAIWCIVLVGFPFVSSMYFLLFHTGINSVDTELYDAARVDGVTGWGIVRYVQIPAVWPYVKVVVTLSLIGSLSGFGNVAALTSGGPGYSTMIPALYMYKIAFGDSKQGYASALGVVLFILIVILTVITNRLMSVKEDKE